jgi:hypothetical protein
MIEHTSTQFVVDGAVVKVPLDLMWARKAQQGSVPLSMPHVTVTVFLDLADDEELLLAQAHASITARVLDADDPSVPLATGVTSMSPPLLPPVLASCFTLVLHDKTQLGILEVTALGRALSTRVPQVPGLPETAVLRIVKLQSQEATETEQAKVILTLMLVARLQQPVPATAVNDGMTRFVDAAGGTGTGYIVSSESAVEVYVDAMHAYACGGGTLCLLGDACSWDGDCVDGHCSGMGVCAEPLHDDPGPTWAYVWAGLGALTILCISFPLLVEKKGLSKWKMESK